MSLFSGVQDLITTSILMDDDEEFRMLDNKDDRSSYVFSSGGLNRSSEDSIFGGSSSPSLDFSSMEFGQEENSTIAGSISFLPEEVDSVSFYHHLNPHAEGGRRLDDDECCLFNTNIDLESRLVEENGLFVVDGFSSKGCIPLFQDEEDEQEIFSTTTTAAADPSLLYSCNSRSTTSASYWWEQAGCSISNAHNNEGLHDAARWLHLSLEAPPESSSVVIDDSKQVFVGPKFLSWTAEEDELLLTNTNINNSHLLGYRTLEECKERRRKLGSLPSCIKKSWAPEEDAAIRFAIGLNSDDSSDNNVDCRKHCFSLLAAAMPGRSRQEIEERLNVINNTNIRQWSKEEESILLALLAELGPDRWDDIALRMGKPRAAVIERYFGYIRFAASYRRNEVIKRGLMIGEGQPKLLADASTVASSHSGNMELLISEQSNSSLSLQFDS